MRPWITLTTLPTTTWRLSMARGFSDEDRRLIPTVYLQDMLMPWCLGRTVYTLMFPNASTSPAGGSGANAMVEVRILIVEDERLIAIDLQRRLTRLGHSVVALAASGMEAIQKALALRPDLVLMDIRLQGEMDGVEAAQQIHASAAIPVVFMTAYVDEETMQRVRATSPWGCLYKPFTPHQVQATLEHVLSGQSLDA